jgi:hypothetical protein
VDHQCGFRRNRSTTDQIFCICQILEIKWEYSETVHQLFIDFKKAYDSDSDQILAELKQAGGETLVSAIHKLINSIWNKEALPDQWKESIIVPIHKMGDKTDCNNYYGISLLSTPYKPLSNILLSRLGPYIKEITGDHQRRFRYNNQLLIKFSAFARYWRKHGSTMRQYISYS